MSEKSAGTRKTEKVFQTTSHIVINPFYTSGDLSGFDYEKELNAPGSFPYTRGVQASMYRGRLWTMRQYAGMGDAEESNKRYRFLLGQGTTGLSVAFDLPTQIGYDSDSPFALGEVGKVGVAIDTIEDMQRLFDGHRSGKGFHLDDHQLFGGGVARVLCRGRVHWIRSEEVERNNSERRPEKVCRCGTYIFIPRRRPCG